MVEDGIRKRIRKLNDRGLQTQVLDELEEEYENYLRVLRLTPERFKRRGRASKSLKVARGCFIRRSLSRGYMSWEIQVVTGLNKNTITRYKDREYDRR